MLMDIQRQNDQSPVESFLQGRVSAADRPNVSKVVERVRSLPHELLRQVFSINADQLRMAMASIMAFDPQNISDDRVSAVLRAAGPLTDTAGGRLAHCLSHFLNADVQAIDFDELPVPADQTDGPQFLAICPKDPNISIPEDDQPGLVIDRVSERAFLGPIWKIINERFEAHMPKPSTKPSATAFRP